MLFSCPRVSPLANYFFFFAAAFFLAGAFLAAFLVAYFIVEFSLTSKFALSVRRTQCDPYIR